MHNIKITSPTLVEGLLPVDVVQVSLGCDFTLVLSKEGQLHSFGYNKDGQVIIRSFHISVDKVIERMFCIPREYLTMKLSGKFQLEQNMQRELQTMESCTLGGLDLLGSWDTILGIWEIL